MTRTARRTGAAPAPADASAGAEFPVTANLVLRDQRARILVLRTARDHDRWQLPGGRALAGETPAAAAARETREETALITTAATLMSVAFVAPSGPLRPGRLAFLFAGADIVSDHQAARIRVDGVEVDRWEFVSFQRALTMLHPLQAARLRLVANQHSRTYLEQ